jgi:hypothetical protein
MEHRRVDDAAVGRIARLDDATQRAIGVEHGAQRRPTGRVGVAAADLGGRGTELRDRIVDVADIVRRLHHVVVDHHARCLAVEAEHVLLHRDQRRRMAHGILQRLLLVDVACRLGRRQAVLAALRRRRQWLAGGHDLAHELNGGRHAFVGQQHAHRVHGPLAVGSVRHAVKECHPVGCHGRHAFDHMGDVAVFDRAEEAVAAALACEHLGHLGNGPQAIVVAADLDRHRLAAMVEVRVVEEQGHRCAFGGSIVVAATAGAEQRQARSQRTGRAGLQEAASRRRADGGQPQRPPA